MSVSIDWDKAPDWATAVVVQGNKDLARYAFVEDPDACKRAQDIGDDDVFTLAPSCWEVYEVRAPKLHKHHDVIVAYAKGAKIQVKSKGSRYWEDTAHPTFKEENEYRVKPPEVWKEQYLPILQSELTRDKEISVILFDTLEEAEAIYGKTDPNLQYVKVNVRVEG